VRSLSSIHNARSWSCHVNWIENIPLLDIVAFLRLSIHTIIEAKLEACFPACFRAAKPIHYHLNVVWSYKNAAEPRTWKRHSVTTKEAILIRRTRLRDLLYDTCVENFLTFPQTSTRVGDLRLFSGAVKPASIVMIEPSACHPPYYIIVWHKCTAACNNLAT
jgi:hypothetical protein